MQEFERIIVALDYRNLAAARDTVLKLKGFVGLFKVGLELLHAVGTPIVLDMLADQGVKVMLDMKLDDIPNTMMKAVRAVAEYAPAMITIHASSGPESVRAAVNAAGKGTEILGVTVLTSMSAADCLRVYGTTPSQAVANFVQLLAECGAQGVVCSPQELESLADLPPQATIGMMTKVIPGIRPTWAAGNDQARVLTPKQAREAGADYLVIGRPITEPPPEVGDPLRAVKLIVEEMEAALPAEE